MAHNSRPILSGQRFLVAEDETIIAMLINDVIEWCGGTVVATATSCSEVIVALGMHALDVIILDVHLRGGSSEAIVAVAQSNNVAVLVCTGSDPKTLPLAFRNLPVLNKPCQRDDLVQAMAKLIAMAD